LPQLKRQIYSRDILFGLEKDLGTNDMPVSSRLPYTLQKATEKDINELLALAKGESKGSIHELLERKWFYENGFHDCYVARTKDTGALCFVAWLVSKKDSDTIGRGFAKRLPVPKDGEFLLENCYTLEKYRGNGIMPSVIRQMWDIARSTGYKRMITYVRQDNRASLRSFEKLGLNRFEEISELKLLFLTRRNHN
jgi:ribosomal protein S18 acetylase RimI-like enzyme